MGALRAFAEAVGVRVAYVKPHGALYNAVSTTRGRLPLSSRPCGCSATTSSRSGCWDRPGCVVPRRPGSVASIVTQALERAKGSVSSLCVHGSPQRRRGRPRRAGRTVLVTRDPRVTTTAVAAPLRSADGTLGRHTGGATSRPHDLSVIHDGADLALVVAACNTSVEAVVERHARTTWEVTFPGLDLSRPRTLTNAEWSVTADVDRVGARLQAPTLERAVTDELPSEEVVRGSCDRAAQLVPGARVWLSRAGAPARRRAPR